MATTTKVRIKKVELAGSTISTATYGRFKFDSEGVAKVPIELARELLAQGAGFTVIDDEGNPIELPPEEGDDTIPGGDDTIPGGEDTIKPEPTIYTLTGGGTYTTIDGGFIISGENSKFTLFGSEIDKDKIFVKDDKIGFNVGANIDSIHMLGVESGSTVIIGENEYKWTDADNNPDNGLELITVSSGEDTITPEPVAEPLKNGGEYYPVDGGYKIFDDTGEFTIKGSEIDKDKIFVKDGMVGFTSDMDTSVVHIIGVADNTTIKVGEKNYKFTDADENPDNGLELVEIVDDKPTLEPIDLPNGGKYVTIDGGFIISGENSSFTLIGDTIDENNIFIKDDKLGFNEGLNPSSIHIIGVSENETVSIGDSIYKYENSDNISSNGFELVLVESGKDTIPGGDDTIPGGDDTIPSGEDTINSGDSVNSFQYNFDGKSFVVTGGLAEDITEEELDEKATFDGEKLTLEDGVVQDINEVHIQGLAQDTKVNVAGEEFTLEDTDNNPDNGLELIGETSDVYGWKFTNRTSGDYESQIWKHYDSEGKEDIVVVGCKGRPTLSENILTLQGDEFKVITNSGIEELTITSDKLQGKLTKGVSWDSEKGIKTGMNTESHIYFNETLFIPKAYLTGVKTKLDYSLNKGLLTITNGTIDPSTAISKGSSVSSIKYKNKTYFVNVKSGKLVQNAWQKRK